MSNVLTGSNLSLLGDVNLREVTVVLLGDLIVCCNSYSNGGFESKTLKYRYDSLNIGVFLIVMNCRSKDTR